MGTSRTAAELAAKLGRLGEALPKTMTSTVAEAAKVVKGAVALASGRYAHSPIARVRIFAPTTSTALVAMTSRKAHLLDHDTKPHAIPKNGRLRVMATPYGPKSSVQHPGTQGKLMWEHGVAAAIPAVGQVLDTNVARTLGSVFGP